MNISWTLIITIITYTLGKCIQTSHQLVSSILHEEYIISHYFGRLSLPESGLKLSSSAPPLSSLLHLTSTTLPTSSPALSWIHLPNVNCSSTSTTAPPPLPLSQGVPQCFMLAVLHHHSLISSVTSITSTLSSCLAEIKSWLQIN